jgi:molybdopterin converting factor subunit 1
MHITVRLFARLRDIAGGGELARDVEEGATVGTVWAGLVRDFPDLQPYGSSISAAVNAEYSRMGNPVSDGDEVAFLPPVSGGQVGKSGPYVRQTRGR